MAKKKQSKDLIRIGHYSFIAGIAIAIIVGLIPALSGSISVWILAILGIVVGLLNISAQEVNSFLIAAATLMIGTTAIALTLGNAIHYVLTSLLVNITIFIGPAAIIVAILSVFKLAQTR